MDENRLAILLFGMAAIFSIGYAVYQHIRLVINRDKINYANATVIDTVTAVPEAMQIRNSRWAYVRFWVNGQEFTSSKRIRVSMGTSIGDEIEIAYFKDNPSIIFTANWKKIIAFLIIGILCLAIILYLKTRVSYKLMSIMKSI